jgi:predicted transcriptional regulator
MRTTITIDEHLLTQVKQRAAATGRTSSQVIEDAIRQSFQRTGSDAVRRFVILESFDSGGYQPGVDLDNNAALLDLMEETG